MQLTQCLKSQLEPLETTVCFCTASVGFYQKKALCDIYILSIRHKDMNMEWLIAGTSPGKSCLVGCKLAATLSGILS